jgi:hypothetical protein
MQGDPSRSVNFVWAGSNGQPRGSYAMMQDPDFNSSTFISSNTISQFYILPGESSFGSVNETATGLLLGADATKFWFEVTEHGHKTVFDQNGAGFPLGETSVLPAEGSCMLIITTDGANEFSETLSLFVQIGVSRLVSATYLTPGDSLFRYHGFQVLKGVNPSSVSVELLGFLPGNNTVVPAVFNQAASASNPHIDVWSVNVTDQDLINNTELYVSTFRLRRVTALG